MQADLSENLDRFVEQVRLLSRDVRTARADVLQVLGDGVFHSAKVPIFELEAACDLNCPSQTKLSF